MLASQEKGKNLHEGSGTRPDSSIDQQTSEQTRGTPTEPYLQQRTTDISELGARIGTETGHVTVSEPRSSHSQTEDRPVLRSWKHQKSHPLDQILTDLNSRVQTRSRLKNFCAFYAFFLS